MLHYTPCPDVIRKYDSIQRNSTYPGDDHYHFAVSICGSARLYFECGDFWKHYKNVSFFSPTSRVTVPINGVQINSMFFTETQH
jgi:hypothetical protein